MSPDANSQEQLVQHAAEQVSHLLDRPGLRQLAEVAQRNSPDGGGDGAPERGNEPA